MLFSSFLFNGRLFKMANRPWADYRNAFVAAHDMVEHLPDDTGTLVNEMMALGTGLWLRSRFSSYRLRNLAIYHIGNDIVGNLQLFSTDADTLPNCPHSLCTLPTNFKEEFEEIMESALHGTYTRSARSPVTQKAIRNGVTWAKYGLLRALQRYDGCDYMPSIYVKLEEKLEGFEDRFRYNKGLLHVAVCPKYGTMDIQFIPENS